MARPRKQPETANESGGELECPECGKRFGRPASLGAHRQRAHGVAGASKRNGGSGSRMPTTPASGRGQTGDGGRRRRRSIAAAPAQPQSDNGVDRDALLRQLFPNGIPPREQIVKRASSWLDEAEKLAALK
jgi:hypothetical protein